MDESHPILPDQPDRESRSTLRLLQRAILNGWELPEGALRAIPAFAANILRDAKKSDRDRLRAAELLASLQRDTVSALIALDKVERLDSGSATERIELAPICLQQTRHEQRPVPKTPSALPEST